MDGRMQKWVSWTFLLTALAIHVMLITSLWTGLLNPLFHDTEYLLGQGADFFAFYQAGTNILNGISCYSFPPSPVVPYFYPYRYLPYFAYSVGIILNLLPPITAYWAWVGLILVSIWLAAWRTISVARRLGRPSWEARIAAAMWFVFSPIYIELYLGQVTLLSGILTFFALTSPQFTSGVKGGLSLVTSWTLGGLAKLIPFTIAPVLLAGARVRTVLCAGLITAAAILVVPHGLESLLFFIDFNAARTMYLSPYPGSHSLKMLILYLFSLPGGDFRVITLLLAGIFITLSLVAMLYSRDIWSCSALFALSYFFIMTDVWEHHYTFLLALLVLGWIRGGPNDRLRWVPVLLTLLMSIPMMPIISLLSGADPGVNPINWEPMWSVLYHSSKVVPALILYCWFFWTSLAYPRENGTLRTLWPAFALGEEPTVMKGLLVQSVPVASEENGEHFNH